MYKKKEITKNVNKTNVIFGKYIRYTAYTLTIVCITLIIAFVVLFVAKTNKKTAFICEYVHYDWFCRKTDHLPQLSPDSPCEKDWIYDESSNKCIGYFFENSNRLNYYDAIAKCADVHEGATLLMVKAFQTEILAETFLDAAMGQQRTAYIGLERVCRTRKTSETFKWQDGTPLMPYSNWLPNQPSYNNSGENELGGFDETYKGANECCGQIQASNEGYGWNDILCSYSYSSQYFCEYKL